MKKIGFTWIVVASVWLVLPLPGKGKTWRPDVERMKSDVETLASEAFAGRKTGQPGCQAAADYICARLQQAGLAPGAMQRSYRQSFASEYFNVDSARIVVQARRYRREFHPGDDFFVAKYSGSLDYKGTVVFAGYGIRAGDYDDLAGVSLKGKMALIVDKKPALPLSEPVNLEQRIGNLQAAGASGALIAGDESRLPVISPALYREDFPLLAVRQRLLDFLFYDSTCKTDILEKTIAETKRPASGDLPVELALSIRTSRDPRRLSENIIARIPGRDSRLREEIVLLGAHYDHLGRTPEGEWYPGANDNASGVAVLLEVLRQLQANQPRRTVLGAFWSGEEEGLFGSTFFLNQTSIDPGRIVACFNMDMAGQPSGKVHAMGVTYGEHIWKIVESNLEPALKDAVVSYRGGPAGSDHAPFMLAGIPSFFISSEPDAANYHTIWDRPELISADALSLSAAFLFQSARSVADHPTSLKTAYPYGTFMLKYGNLCVTEPLPLATVRRSVPEETFPLRDLYLAYSDLPGSVKALADFLPLPDNPSATAGDKSAPAFAESYNQFRANIFRNRSSFHWGVRFAPELLASPAYPMLLQKLGCQYVYLNGAGAGPEVAGVTEGGALADFIGALGRLRIVLIMENVGGALVDFARRQGRGDVAHIVVIRNPEVDPAVYLPWVENRSIFLLLDPQAAALEPFARQVRGGSANVGLHLTFAQDPRSLIPLIESFPNDEQGRKRIMAFLGDNFLTYFRNARGEEYVPRRPF